MRIVSLIASATEILCALGFADALVGISHECDHPPSIRSLPVCTEPKLDVDGTSREIDDQVKAIVEQALSVYRVDGRKLQTLAPTHIITQTQCEVCAVSLKDVERALARVTGCDPQVVSLEPNALADVWADIQRVADALGAPERGKELVDKLEGRMAAVASRSRDLDERPGVACIEWLDPLMAAGNWVPELVERAGGRDLLGKPGVHSPWLSWEDLSRAGPDVVVVMPCGFDMSRIRQELHLLTDRPEWQALPAVQRGRTFIVDGNQYFNRPGPRLVESLEILAELLHPEVFRFGHEGTGWGPIEVTDPGLCGSCSHARVVTSTKESRFHLCNLSREDPRFPRYPQLPVRQCDGYQESGEPA